MLHFKNFSNNSSITKINIERFYQIKKNTPPPKKKSKKIVKCISEMMQEKIGLKIDSRRNYSLYVHEFTTQITSVPFDLKLGKCLKDSADSNSVLKQYISDSKAIDIYTYGSQTLLFRGGLLISSSQRKN